MIEDTFQGKLKTTIEDYVRSNVYTAIPAKVIGTGNFSSQQSVDVEPLVAITYSDGASIKLPAIYDVPVIFPAGGGGLLSFPITIDDTVLLVFCMRSITDWLASEGTGVIVPVNNRFYHIADAVAIPGLYTDTTNKTPSPTNAEMKFNGMSLRMESGGDAVLDNSLGSIKLGSDGMVTVNGIVTIDTSGNIVTTGTINSGAITSTGLVQGIELTDGSTNYSTHTHGGVQTGSGSTGVPQ